MAVVKISQSEPGGHPGPGPNSGSGLAFSQAAQEYVETVAHELRTPLQTASGFLAFLLQGMAGPVTTMQRDMLTSLGTSLEQAQSLVEDLLCLSQLESGQFTLSLELVNLKRLVDDTVENLNLMAEAAGVTFEVEALSQGDGDSKKQKEYLVNGATNRLTQCLRNLLSNALKFSPASGVVRVCIEETDRTYRVQVIDQGPGIRPEHLGVLFERHYQVKDPASAQISDTRHLTGYGLGLSITRELIERQGGRIGVESTYGKGSCFWFSLPKAPVS